VYVNELSSHHWLIHDSPKKLAHIQESARQNEYANRWLSTDAATRDKIKRESLVSLGSPSAKAGGVAAQVVAAIAAVEIPHDQWPDLIGSLLGFVNNPQAATNLKIATLQAIGFICESIVCNFNRPNLLF